MRLRLFFPILALIALLVGTVLLASPYAPVVGAFRPIEEIWAIEDERVLSETPLVTALSNNNVPLAYDAQQNTFYCTLGLNHEGEWPDIHLTAPGASGITLCFTDDYTFDSCDTAIREGYPYEIMAYTDEEYAYFYIVFTGLPVLSVQAQQEIGQEDTLISAQMSAYGEEPLSSYGWMHVRGASTFEAAKSGYLVKFSKGAGHSKKVIQQVPGFGMADNLVLLPLNYDDTKMRDRLSWDVYSQLAENVASFGARKSGYVELFIDGRYEGLYLMLEPYDEEEELQNTGSMHVLTDSIYRTAVLSFSRDRLYCDHPRRGNTGFELYYTQESEAHAFDLLNSYMELLYEEDDAVFAQKTLECMDIDSIVRMEVLVQGGGLTDNLYNNLYVWASPNGKGVTYRFAPWDMDLTWGLKKEDIGELYENWMTFGVFDRMIALDVGGIRAKLCDAWQTWRKTAFSEEEIAKRIEQYTFELNESGAMRRNAERWGLEMSYADGYEIISYCAVRFALLDGLFAAMAASPEVGNDFLTSATFEQKAVPIGEFSL